ncbi:MAG: hypothetical protein HY075_12485, partial [Deltaproteobacteria bacterium]|nr:hypothetical protein [Deltaproteobacteria bacterium]
MKTLLATTLIAGLLCAGGAHAETRVSQRLLAGEFQGAELHGNLEAELDKGDECSLTLEGDADLLARTTSEVRDG